MEDANEIQIERGIRMALRVLMTKKKLDTLKKELEEIRQKKADFLVRENEIEKAIEEANTEEERSVVEENITALEAEKAELDAKEQELDSQVRELEQELAELESEQKEPEEKPVEERKTETKMEIRTLREMNFQDREAMFARDDVKSFLNNVRTVMKEKRAVENVGLLIPEVFLGVLRQNIMQYSKLYKHANVKRLGSDARLAIMGEIPEAVWTECCGAINEMSLTFYDTEVNCWKVAGYYALCNALLGDSDIDLATELLTAIAQGIGIALDKAILYGTGTRMPQGVMARLVQTEQPDDYPTTARPWADLHTSNIVTLSADLTGAALVAAIVNASGAAKGNYSRGEKVWAMNEKTYTAFVAASVSVDASGAIVAGVNGVMPVVGGVIEVLDFIPDNVIIGGYFDNYLLAERAGNKFATSEHVRFLQDQTVFKGVARFDGKPVIPESFIAVGLNGTTPNASMEFAADIANSI